MELFYRMGIFFLLIGSISINAFPCPSQCLCRPIETDNNDLIRLSYSIDCSNISVKGTELRFHAEPWSIEVDAIDEEEKNFNDDYLIELDLSNTISMKNFHSKSVQFTGFRHSLTRFTLSSSSKHFRLQSNSFDNEVYHNVKIFNLSSCCEEIPSKCDEMFQPLKNVQVLDLSGTSMFNSCLSTRDSISATLRDLILRGNVYDSATFSPLKNTFDAVRDLPGHLDLQNSRFQLDSHSHRYCLFDLFTQITSLDLSNIQIELSSSNDVEKNLGHLIKCRRDEEDLRRGEQLLHLYLRRLGLKRLPNWFSSDRFPRLIRLDLSENQIRQIDLQTFDTLRHVSLSLNPLDFDQIQWREKQIYQSINLRSSSAENRTFDLLQRLERLALFSTNVDYSSNEPLNSTSLTKLRIGDSFGSDQMSLNLSQTNLISFELNWDDLEKLDVSSNRLTELNLERQKKLISLDCSNQQLQKLVLSSHSFHLKELRCSNNSLTSIENFSLLPKDQLRLIDLSRNYFDSLENLFGNITSRSLHTLKFQWNRLKIIRSKTFHSQLISLTEIDLSWNRIQTIERQAFQAANLQILDLTGNPLKSVEAKSIFTGSLRLFYLFNNSDQFTDRCLQSSSNDNLLLIYVTWFEENGTYMECHQPARTDQIKLNQCSFSSPLRTKVSWIKLKGKTLFGYYSFYLTIGTLLTLVFFAALYLYRQEKFSLFKRCRRYRRLDRNYLVEEAEEMDQRYPEDDEIVMNLKEPPFNSYTSVPTHV